MAVLLLCNPYFGDSAFHGGCIRFAWDGIRSLTVSVGSSSEGSSSASLDYRLWELCFSLVSPLWESCYSLASC